MRRKTTGFLFALVCLVLVLTTTHSVIASADEQVETPLINPAAPTPSTRLTPFPQYSGCGGVNVPVVNDDYEQRVVELVNQARADHGLPPLKRVDALTKAARYHATDQGQDDYVMHDTYDRQNGELVFVCGTWERTATYFTDPRGENIAAGYTSPEAVMEGWMNSAGHRANILNPSSWEIGVGYFEGSGLFNYYWVQDFAQQSGVYPLILDNEAAATDQRTVNVYIYGSWREMRLRNDDDSWGSWRPFQSQFVWELNPGKGSHAVTAELRSGNTTATSSDTIYLSVDAPLLGNLPEMIVFNFSISQQDLYPAFIDLTPLNTGNEVPLEWVLTKSGDFFTTQPTSGTTPESFRVTAENFDPNTPGIYQGEITVTVTDPPDVEGSPHRIAVQLNVFENIYWVNLPFARK